MNFGKVSIITALICIWLVLAQLGHTTLANSDGESGFREAVGGSEAIGETGVVKLNHKWKNVHFSRAYKNPVVVAKSPTYNGGHPLTIRVKDVTSKGFKVRIHEWETKDGPHTYERLGWMVVEKGHHKLDQGMEIEAGTTKTNAVNVWGKGSWHSVDFNNKFKRTPIVTSVVASWNGGNTVTTRHSSVGKSGFKVAMQEQEKKNNEGHNPEYINYIAITPTPSNRESSNFAVLRTNGAKINHKWHKMKLPFTVADKAKHLSIISDIQTYRGHNTASPRIASVKKHSFKTRLQEERSHDKEVGHVKEQFGVIVMPKGFTLHSNGIQRQHKELFSVYGKLAQLEKRLKKELKTLHHNVNFLKGKYEKIQSKYEEARSNYVSHKHHIKSELKTLQKIKSLVGHHHSDSSDGESGYDVRRMGDHSCAALLKSDPKLNNGYYNIHNKKGEKQRVYCDMKNGGWTLVYKWDRSSGDSTSQFWDNVNYDKKMNVGNSKNVAWWSGDGKRSLRFDKDIPIQNEGEMRLKLKYKGKSMEGSGVYFYGVDEDSKKHNLKCWSDDSSSKYTGGAKRKPYKCGKDHGKTFVWDDQYTTSSSSEFTNFRLDARHHDNGRADRSYLWRMKVWVK